MKEKNKTRYIALGIYLILVGIFYFFTLRSGSESVKESSFVTNVVLSILKFFTFHKVEFDYEVIHLLTRKLIGHFGFNLIIGLSCYYMMYSFKGIGKITLIISGILGLVVAYSGELLQYIPANRGPSFIDALINFSGEICGIFIMFIIIYAVMKRRKSNKS